MTDEKMPNTAEMDDEPSNNEPTAATPFLPTPQSCVDSAPPAPQPVPSAPQPAGRLVDVPGTTICPSCRETVVTKVTFNTGSLTWLVCLTIMSFGFVLGCCLIPFCLNSMKNVNHFCPRCDCHIFKYKRL